MTDTKEIKAALLDMKGAAHDPAISSKLCVRRAWKWVREACARWEVPEACSSRGAAASTSKFRRPTSRPVHSASWSLNSTRRDRLRERIVDVKRDQKQRGRYLGGTVPFLATVSADGTLIQVPVQQTAIREMVRLQGEGQSLRAIAEAMKAKDFAVSHNAVKEITVRAQAVSQGRP